MDRRFDRARIDADRTVSAFAERLRGELDLASLTAELRATAHDAMRQLAATGWMHNRARMVVASFLTKHLGVDWRVGETHFMEHLVDGDPASNSGGWQWAASVGTDPQPYLRILNPTLQGLRHDPSGDYVRRWIPELRSTPGPAVHQPSEGAYLAQVVDHPSARLRALDAYRARPGA